MQTQRRESHAENARQDSIVSDQFAEGQLKSLSEARLRVEAENEIQRFIDWLDLHRARVDYEAKYASEVPLEIRLRSILIKDVADITEEDIKELRTTRQTKTEMWMYDEAKILMVQSAYRKRKGKLQVHMLRQAKIRRQEARAREIEKAEQQRRNRVLQKLKREEALAKKELEDARHRENQEHITTVLEELRDGSHLVLIPHTPVTLSDADRRKLLRRNAHQLRDARHGSLRAALQSGTSDPKSRGHFEKMRLARMLLTENTLRRCFLQWEMPEKILKLRMTMLSTLRHVFLSWKDWHSHNHKLKRKVATSIHKFYAMYIGTAFSIWWKRTRVNYTIREVTLQKRAKVTYLERRDDFCVINSFTRFGEQKVKGELTRRYLVDIEGREPSYSDVAETRRKLKLKRLPDTFFKQMSHQQKEAAISPATTTWQTVKKR